MPDFRGRTRFGAMTDPDLEPVERIKPQDLVVLAWYFAPLAVLMGLIEVFKALFPLADQKVLLVSALAIDGALFLAIAWWRKRRHAQRP